MARRSFKDAAVVVTGAGGGLGRAIALRLASDGARLVLLDRDAAGIESVRLEIASAGRDCLAIPLDVTDPAACASAVSLVVERFGTLDVLVNNAGISHRSALERTSLEVVRRVMDVNFFGAVHCTTAALPHLKQSRGLIVVISSVAGFAPLIARTGYAASKHALHGFFDSLRSELRPFGVDVTLACPSFTATRIDRNALGGDGRPVQHAQVTMGRPMDPAVVADRIVRGAAHGRRVLRIGSAAHVAWWLSRLAPGTYESLMARRFRDEMRPPDHG